MEKKDFSQEDWKFNDYLSHLEEIEAKSQKRYQRFEHRLPPALYHITTKEKVKKILTEGIKPSLRMEGDKSVVFLTDNMAFGKRVVVKTQKVENPEDFVILQINTQKLERELAESFLEERAEDVLLDELKEAIKAKNPEMLKEYLHEVHYEGHIPPESISLYKEGANPNAAWQKNRMELDFIKELDKEKNI